MHYNYNYALRKLVPAQVSVGTDWVQLRRVPALHQIMDVKLKPVNQ